MKQTTPKVDNFTALPLYKLFQIYLPFMLSGHQFDMETKNTYTRHGEKYKKVMLLDGHSRGAVMTLKLAITLLWLVTTMKRSGH